ncbi:hypothetical protein, partial [Streptomyces nanshensis]|uniref:hypothetical protein n=1 Tax=Streptomyces nanshensis TaxID=518642 RepID=UPI001C0D3D1E
MLRLRSSALPSSVSVWAVSSPAPSAATTPAAAKTAFEGRRRRSLPSFRPYGAEPRLRRWAPPRGADGLNARV